MNVTLYRQNVVLERPVRASAQVHTSRSRLFLELDDDGVSSYGEVAPQPFTLNGDPGVDEVVLAVADAITQLEEVLAREGTLPSWSRVARLFASTPAYRVATALVEMAVLDRELRLASRRVSDLWSQRFDTPRQGTFSLLDEDTAWVVDESMQRVRVKTAPGPISERALDRLAQLSVPVLLDFNCSANGDEDVLAQVDIVRGVASVAAVEQPFDVGNLVDHARLASRLDVPLSIDEGVRSLHDLTHIANYEAAAMVCVKPARVGGLANARTMFARADELGLRAYLGGFFESPFARHVHQTLANHCVDEPSDLGTVTLHERVLHETQTIAFSFGVEPSSALLESAERLSFLSGNEP